MKKMEEGGKTKKEVTIVLFDTNRDYIDNFREFLRERQSSQYRMEFFTNQEALLKNLEKNESDLMVVAEEALSEELVSRGNTEIAVLSERDVESVDGICAVYRYQKAEMVLNRILNVCVEKRIGLDFARGYRQKTFKGLVAVYSPVGRCGKTRFCIHLCKELSKRQKKVLLVSLDGFSCVMEVLGMQKEEGDLSDLLYYYLGDHDTLWMKAETVIRQGRGFELIQPTDCVRDLGSTDSSIMVELVKELGSLRGYDRIILDLSDQLSDVFSVLEQADVILLPFLQDDLSDLKIRKLKNYIAGMDYDIPVEKMVEVDMSRTGNGEQENMEQIVKELEEHLDDR